jgi:hypothetical protein
MDMTCLELIIFFNALGGDGEKRRTGSDISLSFHQLE